MATCGYLCPVCEGKGFKEDGSDCDWCRVELSVKNAKQDSENDLEEWIEKVHQGPCCSDVNDTEL